MDVYLGDIVLAEDRKAMKRRTYLITRIGKDGKYFQGIQVVRYLHAGQNTKECVELPNNMYAILRIANRHLRFSDIVSVNIGLGAECGNSIEKSWQKYHSREVKAYWKKARSCKGLLTHRGNVKPAKITAVYQGGTFSGK